MSSSGLLMVVIEDGGDGTPIFTTITNRAGLLLLDDKFHKDRSIRFEGVW